MLSFSFVFFLLFRFNPSSQKEKKHNAAGNSSGKKVKERTHKCVRPAATLQLHLSRLLCCQQTADWKPWSALTGADFQNRHTAPGASVLRKVRPQPGEAALTLNIFRCLSEFPTSAHTFPSQNPLTLLPLLNLSPMSFHSHFTVSLWHLLPTSYSQYT